MNETKSEVLYCEELTREAAMGIRDCIDCPNCKKKIQCIVCAKIDDKRKSPRKRSPDAIYSTLSAARDGSEIEVLRLQVEEKAKRVRELENALREGKQNHSRALNNLKVANEKAMRKSEKTQRITVRKIERKLMDRLNFLELQVPTSGLFEPEGVALAFNGNPWIWAHRHILVAKSILFSKMLENVEVENGYKYLTIRDTSHPIMQSMVSFCYTGLIQFNQDITPEAMLQVAHKYGIQYLKELCDYELCKGVTPENIGRLIRLAKANEAPKLKVQTMNYLKDNFEAMRDTVFENF